MVRLDLISLAFLAVSGLWAEEAVPTETTFVTRPGQPIVLRLKYSGTLQRWDARIMQDGAHFLGLANGMVFEVTDNAGRALSPKKGKVVARFFFDTRLTQAFNVLVNLTDIYPMSKPGIYTFRWGCQKVRVETVRIELIEKRP